MRRQHTRPLGNEPSSGKTSQRLWRQMLRRPGVGTEGGVMEHLDERAQQHEGE